MTTRSIKSVLDRVRTWPAGAQEEALKALREIEEDFIIGPSTRLELDQAHQEAIRGEGVFLDDLKEQLGLL